MQRLVRGHLARVAARRLREHGGVIRLQAWWRGCLGRAKADKLWFHGKVRDKQVARMSGSTLLRCPPPSHAPACPPRRPSHVPVR
jgi:hypothetical protein